MALTRSWAAEVEIAEVRRNHAPWAGWVCLLLASLLIAAGLVQVYRAKTFGFPDVWARLGRGELLDLNRAQSSEQLRPFLMAAPDSVERTFAFLEQRRPLRNVGALAPLHLPLAKMKPALIVRTPAEFSVAYWRWCGAYLAAFWVVALWWRLTRSGGDLALLAAMQVLTGFGLILMVSIRDPLRDTLEFRKFALGVVMGCALLLIRFDYRRLAHWCYTPLFFALGLFALLMKFGSGPGVGSDIKVNLGPFQPVEIIKICVVMFLAGYFSQRWEHLRDLRQKRFLPGFVRAAGLPQFRDVLPVAGAVGLALLFFFLLKDLGPALVTLLVFLAMFVVARGRPWLAIVALTTMVVAVTVGYRLGTPHTVVDRIDMWLAPWDNDVHGGNQLAHALWGFSTGGLTGSGPGWGDPAMIPAGSTDLVLPAIGEEWGFLGVAAVLVLFGVVVWRGLRVAARASTHYGFFLALGLTSLIALEMLLITSGVLGALPLSGVVSPFLSSGNTAMLANFLIVAMLLSVAEHPSPEPDEHRLLARPARNVALCLAAAGMGLLVLAAKYQVVADQQYLAKDARSFEQDGVKRAQRNPRINSIAREIPRGSILDRNGLPVATSDWAELERHRAEYAGLGVDIDSSCSRLENRHYPFGAAAVHITGDLRTGENFHASNASLVEHDANRELQGYEYAELIPVIRRRHRPGDPGMARLLARDRNVKLTIDMRLQLKATEALRKQPQNAAAVVMDAASGDVLALVSTPAPDPPSQRTAAPSNAQLLDRARYGQYPPGSTFKIVTAIAALRLNPALKSRTFVCRGFPGGRAGTLIRGWNRPIFDDIGDHAHGHLSMETAIGVSCNAWFAQLGVADVGSQAIADTAGLLGLSPGDLGELRRALPFATYGQGPVLTTPFKMARVAATIAADGQMPQGRWVAGQGNARGDAAAAILPASEAAFLARAMRGVVVNGTGRRAMAGEVTAVAGKTGTAQVDVGMPHAWFAGFAPYDAPPAQRIAFAVLVEHGGYGGRAAAPIAREIVDAARELNLIPGKVTQ